MPKFRRIVTGAISAAVISFLAVVAFKIEQTNMVGAAVAISPVNLQTNPVVTSSIAGKDETGASYRKRIEVLHRRDLTDPAKLNVPTTWTDLPKR